MPVEKTEVVTATHHEDWDKIWGSDNVPDWDYLSQVILQVLKDEAGALAGRTILEAGSGTGRISLRLAKAGAMVSLLDNSAKAIAFSKDLFALAGKEPNITCASIESMPYADDAFDVVWNAGVVEHFVGKEQDRVLLEMARVCKRGSVIITINPYAKSVLHSFGRFVIEKMGRYPFGDEVPVASLKEKAEILGCKLKKDEYSIGFIVLWVGMFKRLMLLPMGAIFKPVSFAFNKLFCYLDASAFGKILRKTDLALSRAFGGYLLVTIFEKR